MTVAETDLRIEITPNITFGVYMRLNQDFVYVLGNYEDILDAEFAMAHLAGLISALAKPQAINDVRHLTSALFAFVAFDSLEKLGFIYRDASGKYQKAKQ